MVLKIIRLKINNMKIGDKVKIINHKFPKINPIVPSTRTIVAPDSFKARNNRYIDMNEVIDDSKKEKKINPNEKMDVYTYIVTGISYLYKIGEIVGIRNTPETEYEIETGDIAKYIVEIISDVSGWKGKRVVLFPSQIKKT